MVMNLLQGHDSAISRAGLLDSHKLRHVIGAVPKRTQEENPGKKIKKSKEGACLSGNFLNEYGRFMQNTITDCAANKGWQSGEEFAAHQFVTAFNEIQAKANKNAHDKGWYESDLKSLIDNCGGAIHYGALLPDGSYAGRTVNVLPELQGIEDARRIALVHSELSEGLEGLRHGNPPSEHIPEFYSIEEEYADVLIRLMDHSHERGWRLAEAVVAKMRFNATRSHRHGGKLM